MKKRTYGQTGMVSKYLNYKKQKPSTALYPYGTPKVTYSNFQRSPATKYGNTAYRRGGEIKTLDSTFTGAYTNGTYTPDTIQTSPYQMIPLSNSTTCIQALNLCQQGTGISQRVGNKISLKSLRLRLSLKTTPNVTGVGSFGARIMVIYDRQPPSSYPATNTLISSINGGNVIVNGLYTDGINPNFMDRLVVLMDEKISLQEFDSGAITSTSFTGSTDICNFSIDRYVKLKNLETAFSGSNATMTLSLLSTGALYLITMSDSVANSSDSWQLYGSARLRYHDN